MLEKTFNSSELHELSKESTYFAKRLQKHLQHYDYLSREDKSLLFQSGMALLGISTEIYEASISELETRRHKLYNK